MGKFIDLTGKTFGRLLVVAEAGRAKSGHALWLCQCDCGGKTITSGKDLRRSRVKSCGCLRKELFITTHGMSYSPTHISWTAMKRRCNNPHSKDYKNWGGRGIKVCARWANSFENFLADMGEKPEGLTLERKNNDRNYEPENCKWATRKEQGRNSRNNHMVEYQGKIQCIAAWAEEKGVAAKTLQTRIQQLHWPVESALTQKVGI